MQEFPTYILALIHLIQSVFMVSFGVAAYLLLKILQSSSNNLDNPKLFVCIHYVSLYIL